MIIPIICIAITSINYGQILNQGLGNLDSLNSTNQPLAEVS